MKPLKINTKYIPMILTFEETKVQAITDMLIKIIEYDNNYLSYFEFEEETEEY